MEDSKEMRDFIEFYKSMPELWNCKNENYKNKNIRNKSYEKLLLEYKKIKSDGSVEELKKKIANMRTCYRRELKKVIKCQRSGAGAGEIYTPNLWYYEDFHFLRDLEMPLPGRSSLSSDEDEYFVTKKEKKQTSKKTTAANARIEFLKRASEYLGSSSKIGNVEDEAAIYANGWACMYRQVIPNQQLLAKRAIDDILMMARLNKLSYNIVQSISNESLVKAPHFVHIERPYISRTSTPRTISSTPVYSDHTNDSVIFVPETVSNNSQSYKNVVPGQIQQCTSRTYSDFSELLNDSQYQ